MSHRTILYVEDSLDDRFLFERAAQLARVSFELRMVEHGEQAIEYLSGAGRYADRAAFPMPNLLLLDLKMPVLDGFGVLSWIRERNEIKELPVVVYTSSCQQSDVSRAYAAGAVGFLTKPALLDELVGVTKALDCSVAGERLNTAPLTTIPLFRKP